MKGLDLRTLRRHRPDFFSADQLAQRVTHFTALSRRTFLASTTAAAIHPVFPTGAIAKSSSGDRSYRLKVMSGEAWMIDPQSFAGKPVLSVQETNSHVTINMAGAKYPGCALSADFTCRYELATDRLDIACNAFDFRASVSASEWLAGRARCGGAVKLGSRVLGADVRLNGEGGGLIALTPDWQWSLWDLQQCQLITPQARLPIENADIRIKGVNDASFIRGNARRSTLVTSTRSTRDWCRFLGEPPFSGSDLSQALAKFETAVVELASDQASKPSSAFVLSTSSNKHAVHLGLANAEEPFSLDVSYSRLAYFRGLDHVETVFLAEVTDGCDAYYQLAGCSFELGCQQGQSLLLLSEIGNQPPSASFVGSVLKAALPVEGATSLFIEQPEDLHFDLARREIAPPGVEKRAAATAPSGITVKNPRLHVVRPTDRLDLIFELSNLQVHFSKDHPAEFRRINHDKKAQIAVHFSGQHLAEKAFFATAGGGGDPITLPPVPTRLSGPSRLVFDIVGDSKLPFSLDTLLGWERLSPSLVDAVRPPALITEPDSTQTAIEAPFRLYLSPDGQHRWLHAVAPLRREDRTELWHTRLVGPTDPHYPGNPKYMPVSLRAVWSPDYPGGAEALPFDTSLQPRDRRDIVTVTHDATVLTMPVQGRTFVLSGFGAYLDLDGHFPYDCHSTVSLERWLHQATSGQDNKVVLSRRGYLYPFGHRVSLIAMTTREGARVSPTTGGTAANGAYLRKRIFIVIREQTKQYDLRADAWSIPFKSIHIDIPITPPLDLPRGVEVSAAAGTYWGMEAFWPSVDGNLLDFPVTGLDWADRPCFFKAPLLFVEFDAAARAGSIQIDPAGAYLRRLSDVSAEYTRSGRGVRPVARNDVTVAPPRAHSDTSVDLLRIQFEGSSDPQPVCPTEQPQFKLTVVRSELRLPALKGTLRDDENKAWFVLADVKQTKAEVFLVSTTGIAASDKQIPLGFGGQTEKSGGIASPSMRVGGVSRIYGAFGSQAAPSAPTLTALAVSGTPPGPLGQDKFDPSDYLDADATICGCIRIRDIVQAGLSVLDAQMPKVLSRITPRTDGAPITLNQSVQWNTVQLQNWPSGDDGIFVTQQGSPHLVADSATPTQFYLSANAQLDLNAPDKPTATVYARLTNFSAQLLFSGNGVLIRCRMLEFSVNESGQTSFNIDILGVELKGVFLSFIKMLEDFIAGLLGDSGISIQISSAGVIVTLPSFNLPAITMGAFNLQNLSIGSSVELSFRSEPILYKCNFSTPQNPFLVSITIYGGGGAVTLVTDIRRVVLFSATFTFGAFATLNLYIASGSAAVLGGLTYTSHTTGTGDAARTEIKYAFFVHAYGAVTAFGFITVGVDFYLVLSITQGPPSHSEGRVDVSYSVKIGFFKKEFTLSYSRSFSGSGGGAAFMAATKAPSASAAKLTDALSYEDWVAYRRAFAA